MKILKFAVVTIVLVVALGLGALLAAKSSVETSAEEKVAAYIEKSKEYDELNTKLMNATLYVFEEFENGQAAENDNSFQDYKDILTSPFLPDALRTNPAAFAVLNVDDQSKDRAAQALQFVLKLQGIDTHQWEIISPHATKTAVIVLLPDGSYNYLDPEDGVIAMYENQMLLGPYAARYLISNGEDYQKVFIKLAENADVSFYENFAHVMMAPPSYPVFVSVAAPVYEEPILLGELDGSAKDVAKASSGLDLTPYMDYVGQKHKAQVKRTVYFTDPARITFILTEDADPSLFNANIKPKVEGKKFVFEVPQDEALIFDDGKPAFSIFKKDTFVPVDQIIIEHL